MQTLQSDGLVRKPLQKTMRDFWSRDKPSAANTIDKKHADVEQKNPFKKPSQTLEAFIELDSDTDEVRSYFHIFEKNAINR